MKEIEIPFGAKDSEMKGWEYTIPAGFEAEIKDGKVIVKQTDSEDERIRKGLVNFLQSPFIKENLTDEKVAPWLAYLEKQKENPKSADSIPADCVSDAKCEDRWHKVTDSLPDNPREVLCKDEAGNFFIGRYYVGEGWEISNYDDEDKPHHLNPPVSKWIDFPSEKQKEQKKAIRMTGSFVDGSYKFDVVDVPKPAEWSDTDNIGWDEAFACVTRAEKAAKNEEELQNAVTAEKWLKEIKFKYYAYPNKQECSEDDERIIHGLIRGLTAKRDIFGHTTFSSDNLDITEAINWLKSLSLKKRLDDVDKLCSNEWSEEDEKELDHIINILDELGFKEFCKSSRDQDVEEERLYYEEIQFLKRLKSIHPSAASLEA